MLKNTCKLYRIANGGPNKFHRSALYNFIRILKPFENERGIYDGETRSRGGPVSRGIFLHFFRLDKPQLLRHVINKNRDFDPSRR